MHYTLMHKHRLVADLFLDEVTGIIEKIDTVYNEKDLPVGVNVKKGIVDRSALNAWWIASRSKRPMKNRSVWFLLLTGLNLSVYVIWKMRYGPCLQKREITWKMREGMPLSPRSGGGLILYKDSLSQEDRSGITGRRMWRKMWQRNIIFVVETE